MSQYITLEVENGSYPVQGVRLEALQPIDEIGRPATNVRYGLIRFGLADLANLDFFVNWMVQPKRTASGVFTFYDRVNGLSVRQRVHFTNAYCVELVELYNLELDEPVGFANFAHHLATGGLHQSTAVPNPYRGLVTWVALSAEKIEVVPIGAPPVAADPAEAPVSFGPPQVVEDEPESILPKLPPLRHLVNNQTPSPTLQATTTAQLIAAFPTVLQEALSNDRIAELYEDYKKRKTKKKANNNKNESADERKGKRKKLRSLDEWWNGQITKNGRRKGGAHNVYAGAVAEYQAEQLFAALGHTKLNDGGLLIGPEDAPRGRGIDGVWRNGNPPPEYFITETKFRSANLKESQLTDKWINSDERLKKSVGDAEKKNIDRAMRNGQVEKRLLHIDDSGQMTQYLVNNAGKTSLLPQA
jgi:hypothetical protein